jgi:hypothetical protein
MILLIFINLCMLIKTPICFEYMSNIVVLGVFVVSLLHLQKSKILVSFSIIKYKTLMKA